MVFKNVKQLISLGIHTVRLNNPEIKLAVKKLVAAGMVEAREAARLAKAVSKESVRERRIILSFLAKEGAKEWRLAKPHAVRAAKQSKRFAGRVVHAARQWSRQSKSRRGSTKSKRNKKS